MPKLPPKQEHFALEFVKSGNAGQAYKAAGYSPNGADQSASKLLRNSKVSARVAELRNKRAERLELEADDVLAELALIAFQQEVNTDKVQALKLLGQHLGLFDHKPSGVQFNQVVVMDKDDLDAAKRLGLHNEESN